MVLQTKLKKPRNPSIRPRGWSEENQFTLLARTPKSTLSLTQAKKWVCSAMAFPGGESWGLSRTP